MGSCENKGEIISKNIILKSRLKSFDFFLLEIDYSHYFFFIMFLRFIALLCISASLSLMSASAYSMPKNTTSADRIMMIGTCYKLNAR